MSKLRFFPYVKMVLGRGRVCQSFFFHFSNGVTNFIVVIVPLTQDLKHVLLGMDLIKKIEHILANIFDDQLSS